MKKGTVVREEDLEETKHHQNLTLKLTGKSKISDLLMLVQCFEAYVNV